MKSNGYIGKPIAEKTAPIGGKSRLSREEIAAIEVGHTDIGRGPARFLVVAFLLLIVAVPLAQLTYEWRDWRLQSVSGKGDQDMAFRHVSSALSVADIWPDADRWAAVRSFGDLAALNAGMLEAIDRFETQLEDQSLLQKLCIPPVQWVLTGWLKAGNEKTYCGRAGWLFFRPGIDLVAGRGFLEPTVLEARSRSGNEWSPPPQPDPVRGIVHFRDQLRERGVELVVMPVPVKPMIYPEKFSPRFEENTSALRNPSHAAFMAAMRSEGIHVYDAAERLLALKTELPDGSFLQTDTHWTPAAMRRCAADLADLLKKTAVFSKAPSESYKRQPVTVSRHGDILEMLQLPDDQPFYSPQRVVIEPVVSKDGAPWTPDQDAEILLLGDSFCNIYSLEGMGWGASAGFAEQLAVEMGRPVDRIAINDNGAYSTRRELAADLRRGNERLAGKKVVVWQFAARELAVGDWKLIELQQPVSSGRRAERPAGTITVKGTLKAMPNPPTPGAVPYRDAIIALHVNVESVVDGAYDIDAQPEILVYTWVMRDNALTPAARYRPGRSLTLTLKPWDEVRAEYGGYNRLELDDPMLLMLDPFWAEALE